jgi:hypothetical protein
MGKSAVLLLIAGLAVGLWLGFNPTTHKDLVKFWDSTKASQVQAKPSADVNLRNIDTKVALWFRTATKTTAPKSQPTSPAVSNQISAAWKAFWSALQKLWMNFLASIHQAKG